jgi:hypothetical protein
MKRVAAAFLVASTLWLSAQTSQHSVLLHDSRESATDLELRGAIPTVPVGERRFVSYQELLRLPQVDYAVSDESTFPAAAKISGVALEVLRRALGSDADMVVALCADGYRSNYPAAYLAAHHPVLVLTVDGKPQPEKLGPYVISNPRFTPSFKVLSHSDEAQIPFQVVRLDFRSESQVLGAIAPHGTFAPGSPVMDGYLIAQQNCYRCHDAGEEGGHMAGISWQVLAAVAKASPDFFAKYVRTPQAVNPKSRMEGTPDYDDQTIAALRAYFTTFAAGGQ